MRIESIPAPILLTWLVMASAQAAQPAGAPVVVYRGAQSVPAAPYIQALAQQRGHSSSRPESTPKIGVTPLETRLPLMPQQLKTGAPSVRRTQAPVQPFFIMGMDRTSLDWLARMLPTLLAINATGMVVQAANREDWQRLQTKARESGLSLALYPDAGLVAAYGLNTYPVLVVPQGRVTGEGGS
jgi:integrating conjugative element protein (TIGR03765 family)